ncbi:hypothetical protein [Janibacter indicus]|uniref:hypothetical protein n=1 Tax=Janibacter indicus TaxID=857417 RepID=UPI003EC09E5E
MPEGLQLSEVVVPVRRSERGGRDDHPAVEAAPGDVPVTDQGGLDLLGGQCLTRAIAGLGLALTAASAAAVTSDATTTQQVTAGSPDRPITTGWPGGDEERVRS